MRITIRDIARRSNVSTATVSRVLNGYTHVDEATRASVLQAAHALGYPIRNNHSTPRISRSILVLVRDADIESEQERDLSVGEFSRPVSVALQSVLEKHGIATRIQHTRMDPSEAQGYVNDVGIEGLVVLGGVQNHDFINELVSLQLPFVVAGAPVTPLHVNCVTADYMGGMEKAISHLAGIGRKRIGLVNGPSSTLSSEEKYKGYRLELALHDLAFDPAQAIFGDFDVASGYRRSLELLQRVPDLDAIAFAQDTMALGGLRAIKESGRRVPDDIAVTGFYDYSIARFTDPPLTTVHVDFQTMGILAGRRLCMMLKEPDTIAWLSSVPTSLVVRSSTIPTKTV